MDKKIMVEVLAKYIVQLSEKEEALTANEAKILQEILNQEREDSRETKRNIIEIAKMLVGLITTLVPVATFALLFQQGLEFEKDGVIACADMKELMKNMGKLFKVG